VTSDIAFFFLFYLVVVCLLGLVYYDFFSVDVEKCRSFVGVPGTRKLHVVLAFIEANRRDLRGVVNVYYCGDDDCCS